VKDIEVASVKEWKNLPTSTGCYLFKTQSKGGVLYVGKAKNLRSRVRQYFVSSGDNRPWVKFIREKSKYIDFFVVKSEQDALILENELIKKHRPRYNVFLRDDKRYLSLRLDLKHEWPKVETVRKIKKDGAIYLGPFSSSTRLKETIDFMQKIFPLRTCSDKKLYNRSRPCIEYEIKRCVAPCVGYVTKQNYDGLVQSAVLFLSGKNKELLEELKTRMEEASQSENYEQAAHLRDQIQAISVTTEGLSVVSAKQFQRGIDQDAIGVALEGSYAVIVILFIRSGVVLDKRAFEIKSVEILKEELVQQFLERYYSQEVYHPHEILVPFAVSFLDSTFPIKIKTPRDPDKKDFLTLADQNARVQLNTNILKTKKMESVLESLCRLLSLSRLPVLMDCLDISHHAGKFVTASVVRFQDGLPAKDFYRRMTLQSQEVDDYQSMKEAVDKRYKSKEDLPDLIVIDGGKGQLSAVFQILSDKGWSHEVDLIALAKSKSGKPIKDPLNPKNRERVFKRNQKNPILLKKDSAEELLLCFLRDEAHRFAITYHRLKKDRGQSSSALDQIPGMTARTKLKLLRRFGSIDGVREATDCDLLKEIRPKLLKSLKSTFSKVSGHDG